MYVSRKHRNKGVGDALIKDAFEKLKSAEKIRIGGDLFNFFPGVPSDFLDVAVPFFTKHGFIKTGDCYDMVNLNLTKFSYKGLKPEMRYLKSDELQLLQTFIKDAFPGRWEFEVNDYVIKNGSGKEFLCAFVDEKIVGYVRVNREDNVDLPYNTNWCARFGKCAGLGPLGVHKDYRKHGIGYNLLVEAFNTLKDFGYDKVVIDWTGLVGFYQRFGFEIFKRFVYFTKERRIK